MPVCTTEKNLHLHVRTACIAKLTRKERDPSTPHHPCTIAPSTRHSRGSASTVASAGSSSASPPWPTHPGREASPDRKKRGTHRLAAAEHQLLQLVGYAAAVVMRQPSDGLPLSARRGVTVVELPWRRHQQLYTTREDGEGRGKESWRSCLMCVCVCVSVYYMFVGESFRYSMTARRE